MRKMRKSLWRHEETIKDLLNGGFEIKRHFVVFTMWMMAEKYVLSPVVFNKILMIYFGLFFDFSRKKSGPYDRSDN